MIPQRPSRLRLGCALLALVGMAGGLARPALAAGPAQPGRYEVFAATPRTGVQTLASGVSGRARWLDVDGSAVQALREAGRGRVRLPLADGRSVDLVLERAEVLAPGATITQTDARGAHPLVPDVTLFRGEVDGEPGSWVSIACSPGEVLGVVSAAGERWDVGPVRDRGPAAGGRPHQVVNERDLTAARSPFECGADELAEAMGMNDHLTPPPTEVNATPARLVCRVSIDCDYEFYSVKFGFDTTSATNYVLTLMSIVNLIYERDLDVTLEISYLNLWTTDSDPYTQTTTSTELPEFRTYWNANRGGVTRNVAHLFSGRSLGGGIAYVGELCTPTYAYGISSLDASYAYPTNTVTWDAEVVAH